MRIARNIQLHLSEGLVHMYWRCHNKEFYLQNPEIKNMYLNDNFKGLSKTKNKVHIHAFCVMGNHYHQITSYTDGYSHFSNHMRSSHGKFGLAYNKLKNRSGKVSESRPKTCLIQNEFYEMRAHFYVEANPIRAKIVKLDQLRNYKFSSYRFYAFGTRDEYTKFLTQPQWYLDLGSTPKQRQKIYRKLFKEYISQFESKFVSIFLNFTNTYFFGDSQWQKSNHQRVKLKQIKPTDTS